MRAHLLGFRTQTGDFHEVMALSFAGRAVGWEFFYLEFERNPDRNMKS